MSTSTRNGLAARLALLVFVLASALAPAVAQAAPAWKSFGKPGPRYGHRMVYDSLRDRTVLFGGAGFATRGDFGDTWEWDGSTWSQVSLSGPPPRTHHAMAFDAARGRVVMFGGVHYSSTSVSRLNDTWEWDGASWRQTSTTGPSARSEHAMAFDAQSGKVVLFGGYEWTHQRLADTWEWDGSSWNRVLCLSPSARTHHAMACDSSRGRIVLFGGYDGANGTELGDTWEWTGTTWAPRIASGPPPRQRHAMVFDASRGATVLVGGCIRGPGPANSYIRFGDMWEWDGSSWSQLPATGTPARSQHGLSYDQQRDRLVLFAGAGNNYSFHGDTLEWDGSVWNQVGLAFGNPPPRLATAMAFDPAREKVVMFGGNRWTTSSSWILNDTWEWDGSTWASASSAGPSARAGHALAWDNVSGRVLLFGGKSSAVYFGDTWDWDGATWTQRSTFGPGGRFRHAMASDVGRGRVVLFGGQAINMQLLGDTWEWTGSSWLARANSGPQARSEHAMAYDPTQARVLLHGGTGIPARFGDLWAWDGATWTQLASLPQLSPTAHAMVYDTWRDRLVLFGGEGQSNTYYTTWEWDGASWSQTSAQGPAPRAAHAMAFDSVRGVSVLFGGGINYTTTASDDTWEYARDRAFADAFGDGCGSPVLTLVPEVMAPPVLGATTRFEVTNVPGFGTFVGLGSSRYAFGPWLLPYSLTGLGAPGCSLLTSVESVVMATPSGPGTAQLDLAVPNWHSLIGVAVHLQALAFAPGHNAANAIVSNGVRCVVGLH